VHALVVYESMYGNTHQIAEAITEGLAETFSVTVEPLWRAGEALTGGPELLVVGGPTHVRGLSGVRSRQAAVQQAEEKRLELDGSAPGPGLREWLTQVRPPPQTRWYAAFDTRAAGRAWLTGRAAPKIARTLDRLKLRMLGSPESFLVDKQNQLLPGEVDRARAWGQELARSLVGESR
jgi:hypothetical protein